jgi:hypothetical protein
MALIGIAVAVCSCIFAPAQNTLTALPGALRVPIVQGKPGQLDLLGLEGDTSSC